MLSQIVGALLAPAPCGIARPDQHSSQLVHFRERLLRAMLRGAALLGTGIFLASVWPVAQLGQPQLLLLYAGVLAALWGVAWSAIPYRLRAMAMVGGCYALGLTELLSFGYGEDALIYLLACALFAAIFCGRAAAVAALALTTLTLLGLGLLLSGGHFAPLVHAWKPLDPAAMAVTCLTFFTVGGTLQLGIVLLLERLERAWRSEELQRAALERERATLEARVAARTGELAAARDAAEAGRALLARQSSFFETLHQLTLDLLNRRTLDELLSSIVARAAEVLDAPYAELMLLDGDELVVRAFTPNQPFLHGDRAGRGEALLAWQAVDTMRPVTIDDYATWPGRRALYDAVPLRAAAEFPIISGGRCIGVLAVGRSAPGASFDAEQRRQGELFAQLAAVALDNAQLYDAARREVAERRQAYLALQRTAEQLEAQNAELDAFAHTVAHDIKNPLTAVIGYAQLLRLSHRQLDPQQVDVYLEIMAGSSRKIEAIVDDLLLLASAQGDHPVELRPLAMQEVVSGLGARLHSLIAQHGARLVLPERWPVALGYGPWVEEVWANYVSNAIKYGGSPRVVTLGADEPADGVVRFWVRDTGQGLSAEQQARLFTAFTRLHLDQAPGHGLGLSIVQRIVRRLGGEVGVESAPGQGSTFFFTLKAHVQPEAVDAPCA